MRAMLDVVNQNQTFHLDRIDLLLSHLSHHIWTSGPSKVLQYKLTTFTTTFFSSSNSERWNENMEQCQRIRTAFQLHCSRWILRFEGYCVQGRRNKVCYSDRVWMFTSNFQFLFSGSNQLSKWVNASRFPTVSWKIKMLNTIALLLIMSLLWDAQL